MIENVSSNHSWTWKTAQKICLLVTRRYFASEFDAEDTAQEAMLRAWRYRDRIPDGDSFEYWLIQVAKNEALRELQRRRPIPFAEIEPGESSDDESSEVIDSVTVAAALDRLDSAERELVQLRYFEDLTQSTIAERLEVPDGTVKIRLHRTRAKLRSYLENE